MEVGQVLGRYRVVEAIGKGGMASVYAGEHMVLGHRVAIKVLHPHHSSNPAMEARFFNEARAISAIEHPGIVGLYDIGRATDGRAYVVMELLRGETLTARLGGGALSLAQVLGFARQLASALAAAHNHSIIHRDLKPDNVFIVTDPDLPLGERIKVLDFGIAKRTAVAASSASITRTGVLVGTPGYMSPEQCSGAQDVDQRADVYSLGVVLYYMATGTLPFAASSTEELIAEQLYCDPRPASEVNAELPLELGEVITRCMQKEPEDRYPSMDAVLDALDALDEETVEEVTAERGVGDLATAQSLTESQLEAILAAPATPSDPLEGRATLLDPPPRRSVRWQRTGALVSAATVVAALSASLALRSSTSPRPLPAAEASVTHELQSEPDEIREASPPLDDTATARTRKAASREAAPAVSSKPVVAADPAPAPASRARPATRARAEPTSRRAPPANRAPPVSRAPPQQRRQRPPPRAPEPPAPAERERKEDPFASVTTPVVF